MAVGNGEPHSREARLYTSFNFPETREPSGAQCPCKWQSSRHASIRIWGSFLISPPRLRHRAPDRIDKSIAWSVRVRCEAAPVVVLPGKVHIPALRHSETDAREIIIESEVSSAWDEESWRTSGAAYAQHAGRTRLVDIVSAEMT